MFQVRWGPWKVLSPRKVKVPRTSHQDPSAASWTGDCGTWARAGGRRPSWLPALSPGPCGKGWLPACGSGGQGLRMPRAWPGTKPPALTGFGFSWSGSAAPWTGALCLPHPDPSSGLCFGPWESGDWRVALLEAVFLLKQFIKLTSGGQGPLRPQPHSSPIIQFRALIAVLGGWEPS